ncbi:MAG: efflux RND transporter periplasmic adaptor subunit [Candidatus Obscuribacterales bacterium]|nr:efflux RND transporter periplasmic adaptor subunit [Candidatus Obscuribacterales bacterium]
MPVKLQEAKARPIKTTSTFVGQCNSRKSVTIRPQIDGYVTRILRRSGDHVSAGEVLMQINPGKENSALHGVESALAAAQSEKEIAEHTLRALYSSRAQQLDNLNFDQEQYTRYHDLFEQGVASAEEDQKYTAQLHSSQSGIKKIDSEIKAQQSTIQKIERNIQQAKANVNSQKIELGYYTIRAPFEGIIGDIPVKLGDFVRADTVLASLSCNTPLEICIAVPTAQAGKIKIGLQEELLDPEETVVGKANVFFVSPRVNDETQSILVKALFENDNSSLKTGQTLKVRLVWGEKLGLTVPTSAVTHIAEQDFVFVAEGKDHLVAKLTPVKLGNLYEGFFEVESGLAAGQQVVVFGSQNLADGVPIRPQS